MFGNHPDFFACIDKNSIKYIVEIGSHDGKNTIDIAKRFNKAKLYCFEHNPDILPLLIQNLKSENNDRIQFRNYAMGHDNKILEFIPVDINNLNLPKEENFLLTVKRLDTVSLELSIPHIDILFINSQDFKLDIDVMEGCGDFLSKKIKFIVIRKIIENKIDINNTQPFVHMNHTPNEDVKKFMDKEKFGLVSRSEDSLEYIMVYKNLSKN